MGCGIKTQTRFSRAAVYSNPLLQLVLSPLTPRPRIHAAIEGRHAHAGDCARYCIQVSA
jgi:hypothetical protein